MGNADRAYQVAAVQLDGGACREDNLQTAAAAIDEAASAGATLVCLPEVMDFVEAAPNTAMFETTSGPTAAMLAGKAREHGVYIHGGSLHERIEGDARCYNTSLLFAPDGEILARYRKTHMFDVALADGTCCAESARVRPGDEVVVAETPLGVFGCAICYDIRFPELFRMMALAGAQMFLVPANFTRQTGRDHWEALLRARAIENGCYVVATNQCGAKPEFIAHGHSMIIDPWGEVLAEAGGDEPQIIYADIDLGRVAEVRAQIPSLANRRADLYGSFGL